MLELRDRIATILLQIPDVAQDVWHVYQQRLIRALSKSHPDYYLASQRIRDIFLPFIFRPPTSKLPQLPQYRSYAEYLSKLDKFKLDFEFAKGVPAFETMAHAVANGGSCTCQSCEEIGNLLDRLKFLRSSAEAAAQPGYTALFQPQSAVDLCFVRFPSAERQHIYLAVDLANTNFGSIVFQHDTRCNCVIFPMVLLTHQRDVDNDPEQPPSPCQVFVTLLPTVKASLSVGLGFELTMHVKVVEILRTTTPAKGILTDHVIDVS